MASEKPKLIERFNPVTGQMEKILRMKMPKMSKEFIKENEQKMEEARKKREAIETVTEKQKRLEEYMNKSYDAIETISLELGQRLGWTEKQIEDFYNKQSKSNLKEFKKKQEALNKERLAVGLPAAQIEMGEAEEFVLHDIPH